jgi:two-component system KDP operon response regulator KdpE
MARILLVNNDAELRFFHRVLLETDGYEILEAMNAAAARKLLAYESVDAIVWDMQLKSNESWRHTQEIHSQYPHLPIVVNAGKHELRDFRDALGAVAVVPRGFGFPEVESMLSRIVSPAREQR